MSLMLNFNGKKSKKIYFNEYILSEINGLFINYIKIKKFKQQLLLLFINK